MRRHNRHCTPEQMEMHRKHQFKAKLLTGLLVIALGVLILMSQLGFHIPQYLYSWEVILIAVGFISVVRHRFRKTFGYVLMTIGTVFLLNDFYPETIEMRFVYPAIIILVGISIVLKSIFRPKTTKLTMFSEEKDMAEGSDEDVINSSAIFGGVTKTIVSKNFQGGQITTIFGGTELNFLNADFKETVVLDLTCVFGGITISVPSNWKVISEVSAAFGGIDDKRPVFASGEESGKTLILKGSCVFGGIEISDHV